MWNATAGHSLLKARRAKTIFGLAIAAVAMLSVIPLLLYGQDSPRVTAVDPVMGKVNDSVTLTGQNLGKETVSGVFLSDDKDDFKATIVSQENDKIVIKVPAVKPGSYNVSIQAANAILIQPVKFTVE